MDVDAARRRLVAQHDRIRVHLTRSAELAGRLRDGEPVHVELDAALAELRSDLAAHNATEVDLIRPLLLDSPDWGSRLVDRMLQEHVAEHSTLWDLLVGSADEVAVHIDDLIDDLDAHLAAEERTFLSPHVLRQDVITRHRRQEPT